MARDWPEVLPGDEWVIEGMEESLADPTRSPEDFAERAKELRQEAAETEIEAYRDTALILAEHYEDAAAARLAA
jgi:hypothetical protein